MDPEGLEIELLATAAPSRDPAIVGLNSVTLAEANPGRTEDFLCGVLGACPAARQDDRASCFEIFRTHRSTLLPRLGLRARN
jgi:hypothetical protein